MRTQISQSIQSASIRSSRSIIFAVVLVALLLGVLNPPIYASTYYVDATTGDDSADGLSLASPFKTIQRGANAAAAGDTVSIRAGTYRETVRPARSGTATRKIRFTNYNGETVIVSGADIITGWMNESPNIYHAPMPWNLNHMNQVFKDAVMQHEARWPNNAGDLINCTSATIDSASDANHLTDAELSGMADGYTGSLVSLVTGLVQTATVTGYDTQTHTLTFTNLKDPWDGPIPGDGYYLSGIKNMLDSNYEWWYDAAASRLYVYSSSGIPTDTEAKRRMNAFNLSGRDYIEIVGIHIFAATITTDSSTDYCLIEGCTGRYLYHSDLNSFGQEQLNTGILLQGTHNVVRKCDLRYSSGSLITVKGTANNVINSIIDTGCYIPNWEGLVFLNGADSLISHNTVSNAGRALIYYYAGMSNNEIQYNVLYGGMRLSNDGALIYGPNCDGGNTEIHHNIVYDASNSIKGFGIYLDGFSHNFLVYNNILWASGGMQFNPPCQYILAYNNVAWDVSKMIHGWYDDSLGLSLSRDFLGARIYNNIITGIDTIWANAYANTIHYNNITSNPRFADSPNHDYHLISNSPAINAGVEEPGITDGFVAPAPDYGAYELGTDWKAGHDWTNPPNPIKTEPTALHRNRVMNGGFEIGTLAKWNKTGAGLASITTENHWGRSESEGLSRSQWHGVRLGGSSLMDGLEQTITGLTPLTTYKVASFVRSPDGAVGTVGVRGHGGAPIEQSSSSANWTLRPLLFTTGASNTSAVVYLEKSSEISAYVYFDDMGLQVVKDLPFADGFENGFASWPSRTGAPAASAAHHHEGNSSFAVDGDRQYIEHPLDSTVHGIATVWFYDTADPTMMAAACVYAAETGKRAWLGVDTARSVNYYCHRIAGSPFTPTSVPRSVGWHKFEFDTRSGYDMKLRIDDVEVTTLTLLTHFKIIGMGDYWADGQSGGAYFDDILCQFEPYQQPPSLANDVWPEY